MRILMLKLLFNQTFLCFNPKSTARLSNYSTEIQFINFLLLGKIEKKQNSLCGNYGEIKPYF